MRRKYYIDHIRSFTILLVVIYHVIYIFNSVIRDGVIGPVTDFHGQDVVQYLLYPWFMMILFLISGICSKYYLDRHTDKEYRRARTRKLLIPSTLGLLVIGWMQGYFNMAISHAFEQMDLSAIPKVVLYLIMCVSGIGVLWTIQVMWILSMVLLLIRKLEKGRLSGWMEHWLDQCNNEMLLLILVLLVIPAWGCAQILNTPVIAVYRFGIYGFAFLLGYYVFSWEKVTDCLARFCIPLIIVAAALGIAYTWHDWGQNYAVAPSVDSPLAISYGYIMCLAIPGGMKRWCNRKSEAGDRLASKSFGLYIFHYLPLSACAYFLYKYTELPGVVLYLLTAIAAFGGALLLYEIFSRIPVLRFFVLGIKKEKKALTMKSY